MSYFNISHGISKSGEFVSSMVATMGDSYSCVHCSSELILEENIIREKYFSHLPNDKCNSEIVNHLLAKYLIRYAIKKNAEGRNDISIIKNCSNCSDVHIINIPKSTFSKALEDVSISGYMFDVVAYRNNKESLGIEILQFHKVNGNKDRVLDIHWLVMNANEIIKDPFCWKPITFHLKATECEKCKQKSQNIITIAKKWGLDQSIFTTERNSKSGKYIADIIECFKCKSEIPVFWWPDVPFSEKKPPEPTPFTIQFRYSKRFGGFYYMNTCPNCNVALGDNFLFLMSNAIFKGLPLKKDNHSKLGNNSGASLASEAINFLGLNRFR